MQKNPLRLPLSGAIIVGMRIGKFLALAALAASFPVGSLAVTHKVVHNYKEKPARHEHAPHARVEKDKHKVGHGKEFARDVKNHARLAKAERKDKEADAFGVHKEK